MVLLFLYYLNTEGHAKAQTMTYVTLVVFQIFNVFNCRHKTQSIFMMSMNKYVVYATLASITLLLSLLYIPVLSHAVGFIGPGIRDWGIVILTASTTIMVFETKKFFARKSQKA